MRYNCFIELLKTQEVQNSETGYRATELVSTKKLNANKSSVGTNTYWYAKQNNIELDYTFTIIERMYNFEKYVRFNNEEFEIVSTSNALKEEHLKLNCRKLKKDETLRIIPNV